MVLFQIILATILVGLISFIGLIIFGLKLNVRKATSFLISLASGTMLGSAFLHMMPQIHMTDIHHPYAPIAIGVIVFFILEKFLIWRHCHLHQRPEDHTRPVAASMVITGDAVHNFIDGVIIASAFMAGMPIGLSVTVAIIMHELPQEMGDFGVLIHGGFSVKKALTANAISASFAVVGGILAYFFLGVSKQLQAWVLPLATGGFLYIALADLIPQMHEKTRGRHSIFQIGLLLLGFGIMYLLKHEH